MNVLAIGSKITIRSICNDIVKNVEKLNLVDYNINNYLNWNFSGSKNVNFFAGDLRNIDTLINSGLNEADVVIVDSSNDIETLFIAQKSKVNPNIAIFVVLEDLNLTDTFEPLGFIVFDSHNLKITKLTNKLNR